MALFSVEQREQLRTELVAAAQQDPYLCGAAHTGSAAIGKLDRWSDIDLALCLKSGAARDEVIAKWTARLYDQHQAVAHQDVMRGATLFRVFLLANTLQVDIAFWDTIEFGAIGPNFELIFGEPKPAQPAPLAKVNDLIGMAWLYALHVRSSLARHRYLQVEYMLSGMRNNVYALACVRCGVNDNQGRGLDDLPPEEIDVAETFLPRSLNADELSRTFRVTMNGLIDEIQKHDSELAAKLAPTLKVVMEAHTS